MFSGVYRGHAVAVKFAQKSIVDGLIQKGALETLQQVGALFPILHCRGCSRAVYLACKMELNALS